ncbi:MAG TPA: alpha/beta hydrolase [Baekduia sp.]|nr:alpha/beta hydrolase [Baekduia sp.]
MHLDVAALRAASRARAAERPRGPDLPAVGDLIVPDTPGVRARRYRPSDEPRPLLVYLHGGMWILGDLDTHDRLCRRIAAEAGVEVLAIDYRRAPEHRWPAAVDDAVAAVRWASESTAAPVLGIGGDSAGGCVAALAAIALRDAGEADLLAAQVLFCPNTDLTGAQPSMGEPPGDDAGVDPAVVLAAARLWMPDVERHADGAVSPLFARDLSGLPPAVVITAGHDPLRDEGEAYAARLRDAGVDVVARREPGLPHGFVQNLDLTRADAAAATDRAIADVARALAQE